MLDVKGHAVPQSHYINGSWIDGEGNYAVFSPINGEILGEMPAGTEADVQAAVTSAHSAFPAWAALGAEDRLPILKRFAEEVGKRAEALCEVESADAGILLTAAAWHYSLAHAQHYLVRRSSTHSAGPDHRDTPGEALCAT